MISWITDLAIALVGRVVDYLLEGRLNDYLSRRRKNQAIRAATEQALRRFHNEHPSLRDLFDETFVRGKAASELKKLASRSEHPSSTVIAERFASYFAGRIAPQAFVAASQRFLELLEQAMQEEPELQPTLNSRDVRKIEERTRQLTVRPTEADLRAAALELGIAWRRVALLESGDALVDLDLAEPPRSQSDRGRIVPRDEVIQKLTNGERIVVYGEPGAGKSTTIYQLGQLIAVDRRRVPVLVRLSEWARTHEDDLASHLASLAQFQRHQASVAEISRLISAHGVLLFDGWNEVEPARLHICGDRLERLARDYPTVGVLATSRPTSSVPLFGAATLELQRLSAERRRELIQVRLPEDRAAELLSRFEWDIGLSSATRTPLLLAAAIRLAAEHATVAASRSGLLRGLVEDVENRPPHALALRQSPVAGLARPYLDDLAGELARRGGTQATWVEACEVVARTQLRLGSSQSPARHLPSDILESLCAHHVLVRSRIGGEDLVGFVHEQIQEWFGGHYVGRQLYEANENKRALETFRRSFIDQPSWEQELLFLCEDLAEQGESGAALIAKLARLTLAIDPVFAGRLARAGGDATWAILEEDFGALMRSWYSLPGEMHRERALAAMISTGQGAFADILLPLVESDDQQVRLRTLRALEGDFSPRVLGSDLGERINVWSVECRRDFVAELARVADEQAYAFVAAAARDDPSTDVRIEALISLAFWGRSQAVRAALGDASPEIWRAVVERTGDQFIPDILQLGYHNKLTEMIREHATTSPGDMVEMLLNFCSRGLLTHDDLPSPEDLLYKIDMQSEGAYHLLGQLAPLAPVPVAVRLVEELELSGRLPPYVNESLIAAAPPDVIDQLVRTAVGAGPKNIDCKRLRPVVCLLQPDHCRYLQKIYFDLSQEIQDMPWNDTRRTLSSQCNELLRLLQQLDPNLLLSSLAELPVSVTELPIRAMTNLLAGLGNVDGKEATDPATRRAAFASFRLSAERLVSAIEAADDLGGGLGAHMACFLGRFAAPADAPLFDRLLAWKIHQG